MNDQESDVPTISSVRTCYLEELRRFLQRKAGTKPVSPAYADRQGSRLDARKDVTGVNFWQKLVSYCEHGGLDYARLIKAFFIHNDKTISNFMLLSHDGIFFKRILPVYESLRPTVDTCRESLESQKAALRNHIDKQFLLNGTDEAESVRLAMAVNTSPYSALFRCCMLNKIGDDYSAWLLAGYRQYRTGAESYDTAWGDLIPPRIRELAAKRRAS